MNNLPNDILEMIHTLMINKLYSEYVCKESTFTFRTRNTEKKTPVNVTFDENDINSSRFLVRYMTTLIKPLGGGIGKNRHIMEK